jgi:hypothetical protein
MVACDRPDIRLAWNNVDLGELFGAAYAVEF